MDAVAVVAAALEHAGAELVVVLGLPHRGVHASRQPFGVQGRPSTAAAHLVHVVDRAVRRALLPTVPALVVDVVLLHAQGQLAMASV